MDKVKWEQVRKEREKEERKKENRRMRKERIKKTNQRGQVSLCNSDCENGFNSSISQQPK
jgi:hypothetical protein